MTNREYYSTENKSAKEMMEDLSKSGLKNYDDWLNSERITFSDEISFITDMGREITPEETLDFDSDYDVLKYVCIKNDILKSQNACFKVLLNDLDADTEKVQMAKWSNNNDFIDDITALEDGIISGEEITDIVSKNHDLNDFPAFKICFKNGGFLPTLFQFHHLWNHKDEISAIMKKNGWKRPFEKKTRYWTSSQCSATLAWLLNSSGDWYNDYKMNAHQVLQFFTVS